MKNDQPWMQAISAFVTVIVIAGALYSGIFFFSTVRALIAHISLPFAERSVQAEGILPTPQPTQEGQEAIAQPIPTPMEKITEPMNILLLGIDQREGEKGPWRTDTMILVSIDPVNKTAAMLSIPRDLWTTIPGYGENRINTAHYTGDLKNYPGGGPALAKKTVWYALGVPVHRYVRVNFTAFEKLVDAIGGLTIEVAEPIHDTKYPTEDYGTMEIYIPAGIQHMDGRTALQYARSRHGSSDFERMKRQQQLLLAARDKIMSLDIPLSQIPRILELVGDSVQTDLTIQEIFFLADIARQIPRENIRYAIIDTSMTTTVVTPQGWVVEVPNWEKVRTLVSDLFPTSSTATQPSVAIEKQGN